MLTCLGLKSSFLSFLPFSVFSYYPMNNTMKISRHAASQLYYRTYSSQGCLDKKSKSQKGHVISGEEATNGVRTISLSTCNNYEIVYMVWNSDLEFQFGLVAFNDKITFHSSI